MQPPKAAPSANFPTTPVGRWIGRREGSGMRSKARLIAAGVLTVAIGGVLVVGVSASASAFVPAPTGPSSGSLSDFLVGVPSSVLGAAQTSPAEGALSANTVTTEPSEDFDQWEKEFEPPVSAPGSPLGSGGALFAASVAWGYRADIADGVNGVFGVNAQNSVCEGSSANGAFQPAIAFITGQDCSNYGAVQPDYVANSDQADSVSGGPSCGIVGSYGDICVQLQYTCRGNGSFKITYPTAGGPTIWIMFDQGGSTYDAASQPNSLEQTCVGVGADPQVGWIGYGGGTPSSYCMTGSSQSNDCLGANQVVSTSKVDPVRTIKCVVVTTTGGIYSKSSAGFLESSGVIPSPVCPDLPLDSKPSDTKYYESTPGQPDVLIEDLPATSPYADWAANSPSKCLHGTCALDVESTSTPRLSCNSDPTALSGGVSCADWFTDPNRSTDWVCTYGGSDLSLAECNVLSQFYKPASLQDGNLYADPQTGDAESGSSPKPGTLAPGTPVADPSQNRNCFPSGWAAFNPVEWVLEPVGCALQWAFVPRQQAVDTATQTLQTDFDNTPPGKIRDFATGIVWPNAPTGCSGYDIDFSGFKTLASSDGLGSLGGWDGHTIVLAACEGDVLHPYAIAVNIIISAVFVFGGILAMLRLAGRLFGYGGPGSGQS